MNKIAALHTCHNRKEKTINSLSSLYAAKKVTATNFKLDVYLTDDGSTDHTSEEVKNKFPEVKILEGDGNLFWAEGMRNSWNKALVEDYDGYLLINDDVEIYECIFDRLFEAHQYCLKYYNREGIYIGPTEDRTEGILTYSGSLVLNKFLYTQKRLPPNGTFQKCDLANANIMLVTKTVVQEIGIFTKGYSHGMADYDYTLMASRKGIPVLVATEYCGHCVDDHDNIYNDFAEKTFKERKQILHSPTGLAFDSYKKYMRKFFPIRYPLVVIFGWIKLYFPDFYTNYFTRR